MPHLISKYVFTVIKITLYVNMTESAPFSVLMYPDYCPVLFSPDML